MRIRRSPHRILRLSAAAVALLLLAPPAVAAADHDHAAAPAAAGVAAGDAAAAFESIKSLQGRWQGTAAGEPGGEVVYEVTANGTVVMERMFPGTEHEMVSMYHLVDGELVLTHYCSGGNQPTLKLVSTEGGTLSFDFAHGTNLDPATDGHIHAAALKIGDDALHEVWTSWKDGAKDHDMTMALTRAE